MNIFSSGPTDQSAISVQIYTLNNIKRRLILYF